MVVGVVEVVVGVVMVTGAVVELPVPPKRLLTCWTIMRAASATTIPIIAYLIIFFPVSIFFSSP